MTAGLFVSLIYNAALLLAFGALYDVAAEKLTPKTRFREVVAGIVIGLIGAAIMANPVPFRNGIVFDTRSILLGISGLFFGLVPTAGAAAVTALVRIQRGGVGALTGVSVIVATAGAGLLWRYWRRRRAATTWSWSELYAFGVTVHLLMLLCMFLLPRREAWAVLGGIALPVMVVYPLATLLLGELMVHQSRRRQSETEKQQAQRRFRKLIERGNDVVCLADARTRAAYISSSFSRITGHSPHDYLGRPLIELIHPDEQERVRERLGSLLQQPFHTVTHTYRIRRGDGSWIPMELTAYNLLPDPDIGAIVINARDVSERAAGEERLARINQCLSSLDSDHEANLGRITALCGELLGGTCALYNRLEKGLLCSLGQWRTPPGYQSVDKPRGHICADVIARSANEVFFVDNLQSSPYAESDPNVRAYNLQAYIGHAVRCRQQAVGSLCVVFQHPYAPSTNDRKIMGILAAALGTEEDRYRIEKDLLVSRERLETAVEATDHGLWDWSDLAHTGMWWSPKTFELIGYEDGAFPPTLEKVTELLHPEDRSALEAKLREASESDRPVSWECRLKTASNGYRWFLIHGRAFFDGRNRPVRLAGSIRDITQRKTVEAALQESESRYRSFLDSASDLAFIKDDRFRYLLVNRANREFFGIPEAEILGKTDRDLMPPGAAEHCLDSDRRALEGEGVIVDEERVGEQVYEIRKFPLSLGDGIKGVGGLIRDVTENRRTLEELKQTTEELNRYFSTALDLFCIADAEGSFRRLNQRWEEVLGLPLKEIGGRRLLDFVHPEDREKTVEALRRLREGKPLTNFLNRYRHRDGSYRHIEWRAIPEGPLIYAAARDVSDRVRGEEERAGIEARLRQAQKMEAIGNLAGGIAHDFNNMLNVIINYADLALSDPGLSREIRQDLKEIKKAGEHSADLTRQLLAFSRKQIISPRAVDLNAAVAENMDMLRRLIGEDIEITFKPGAGIGTIWIDPSQVVQILTNLAANARDAIAGTGIISIETAAVAWERGREPAGSGRNLEEYVSLVFTDSGTGIDPDKTDRIFEPFFTTKEVGKGTGLGLATVYGIVAQNGGSIEVTTAAGRGASFIISFPRYRGETGGGGCEKTPAAEGTGETILLVEDDPRVLSITEKMLQRCGYEVLSAGTAERACELAGAERKIDLLLTDVVMPTTNGKQLRRRIETLKPGIKTVFMSGYTADVIAERGVLNRSVAFISKPFSVRELRAKIREVLDS